MAAQFTSYPPYHPSPFVVYNQNKNTLLSDIGDALSAVGKLGPQWQQQQLQNQLNQLLLTSLTAPRTEQQQTTPPIGGIGYDEEGNVVSAQPEGLGSMLIEAGTKTVPGKAYTEATGRLEDVGYAGGGFNFRPTKQLTTEDWLTRQLGLAAAKGEQQRLTEGTKQKSKLELEEERGIQKRKTQQEYFDRQDKQKEDHDKRMADIAKMQETGKGERARAAAEETNNYRQQRIEIARQNARTMARQADSMEENRNAREQEAAIGRMERLRSQAYKVLQDKPTPQRDALLQSTIDSYNKEADKANLPDLAIGDEELSWWGTLIGRTPAKTIVPGTTPAPTTTSKQPTPSKSTTPPTMYDPRTMSDEEVRKRREQILKGLSR